MIDKFDGEYRWLSNFWLCPVAYQGKVYPSVENAYQAAKYERIVGDNAFLACTPGKAKRMGSKIDPGTDWHEGGKVEVMQRLLEQKFQPGRYEAVLLDNTNPHKIVEGNTWGDTFWGVCDGTGDNHLGKIIMNIRSGLINP